MLGWQLFQHSIQQIVNNLGAAIRIFGFLFLLVLLLDFVVFSQIDAKLDKLSHIDDISINQVELPFGYLFVGLLATILMGVAAVWTAVSWHRFILLGEQTHSLTPNWNGEAIWAYIKKSMLIAILILLAGIPLMMLAGMITSISSTFILLPLLILLLAMTYLSLRISLILPSAALAKPMRVGHSMELTREVSSAIWIVALLLLAADFGAEQVIQFLSFGITTINNTLTMLTEFALIVVGISILTTLYGHLVENRELQ